MHPTLFRYLICKSCLLVALEADPRSAPLLVVANLIAKHVGFPHINYLDDVEPTLLALSNAVTVFCKSAMIVEVSHE